LASPDSADHTGYDACACNAALHNKRAAESMRSESAVHVATAETDAQLQRGEGTLPQVEAAIRQLQQQMWEHAGLLRDAELLKSIDLNMASDYAEAIPSMQWTRREYEARSLARVARAIVLCALAREESRGAHYRNDFPKRDDARFGMHSHLAGDAVSFGPLLPVQRQSDPQPESPALR
jgi:L-aspartate oxidase